MEQSGRLFKWIVEAGSVVGSLGSTKTQSDQEPLHMPDEVLLTFTSTVGPITHDHPAVQTLLQRAEAAAGSSLQRIDKADAPGAVHQPFPDRAQPPLTLRLSTVSPAAAMPGYHHAKRVTDRINGARATLYHQGVSISSAMPNWLLSSAETSGSPHPGPGTIADPAHGGAWNITVPDAAAWPVSGTAPEKPVIVAVLDTSPGRDALEQAAGHYRENELLQRLDKPGVICDWDAFSPPQGMPSLKARVTPDHGLFVSGIVHSIAPHAQIHLLHIFNEHGAGRTDLLLDALDYCLSLAHQGYRVVVNMSLYLMVPPEDELWTYWFGPVSHRLTGNPVQLAELLDALDEALEHRINLLLDAGVLLVAAAGNDAFLYKRHTDPRLPAAYDNVLCVVATDCNGKIANYANHANVPSTANAVATYGGQGVQRGEVAVVPPGDPRDGVVGVYTHHSFDTQDGPTPNESGWAYWSGSSFATPMVSGMAANLLAEDQAAWEVDPRRSRLTPLGVMRKLIAMGQPNSDPALDCPYVEVTQQQ
jgi:hypothetical protein